MKFNFEKEMNFNKRQVGCTGKALSALKGFTEKDIADYVSKVRELSREKGISMKMASREVQKEFGKRFHNRAVILRKANQKIFGLTQLGDKVAEKKLTLNDILTDDTLKMRGTNAESYIKSLNVEYNQKLYGDMSEKAQEYLRSDKYIDEVAHYLDTGVYDPNVPEIKEIGDSYKEFRDRNQAARVQCGSLLLENANKYREIGMHYDPVKVGGKDTLPKKIKRAFNKSLDKEYLPRTNFIKFMRDRANLNVMFPYGATSSKIEESLGNMYDNILRGENLLKSTPKDVKVLPDIEKNQTMFWVPKDMKSYVEAMRKYGIKDGSLHAQIQSEMNSVAREVGLRKVLGPSPYWAFNKLYDIAYKNDNLGLSIANPVHVFDDLTGATSAPERPLVAQMLANFRAYRGAVKQVTLQTSSLNDFAFGNMVLTDISKTNYFQNILKKINNTMQMYAHGISESAIGKKIGFHYELPEDTKRILKNMSNSILFEQGAMMRHYDMNNVGDITRKVLNTFWSATGMEGKDIGSRSAAAYIVASSFGDEADKEFYTLNPVHQKRLNDFEISPSEWNMLRKYIPLFDETDTKLFTPDVVSTITDSDMKLLQSQIANEKFSELPNSTLLNKTGSEIDDIKQDLTPELSDVRSDLFAKVSAMLENAAQETVLFPGAYQRAIMNRGNKGGTAVGELLKDIWQFKGFMLSYAQRVLINGYKQDSSKMKWKFLLSNLIYTTGLTLLSNTLYNFVMGRPINLNPANWTLEDWVNNLVPGVAMFNKLLDPKNQNSNMALQLLQSPSLDAIGDLLSVAGSGINLARPSTGTWDKRKKRFKSKVATTVSDFTPINSTPFLSKWWKDNFESTKGN